MPFKNRSKQASRLPRWSVALLALAAFSLFLYILAACSTRFADFFNRTVAALVRALLAHVSSLLPISLAELFLYSLPLLVVLLSVIAYRRHCATWRQALRYLGSILSVFSLLLTLFVFTLGTGYHTTTLEKRLHLTPVPVTEQALTHTAKALISEVNVLASEITYGTDGFSQMPYDLEELNALLLEAYHPLCEEYGFIQELSSRIKPVLASKAMSYTHITGVYSFFTGEANLNVYFPHYTLPFTAAHELAHQRGIARENEANFVAFLVCQGASDPYIRYAGALNLLEYVLVALHGTDATAYAALLQTLDARVLGELRAYAAFFQPFSDSLASQVSDRVNDTYLKLHGNKEGTASYGLVVELAVAYYQA